MSNLGFWDWVTYGGILFAAVACALETALNSSALGKKIKPPSQRGWIGYTPILAILISAGAFAKQQFTPTDFFLPTNAVTGSPFGIIQAWGLDQNAFYIIVKTDSIQHKGSTQHLMLIIRPNYANLDKMTDTNILRSQSYTILDGFMTLAVPTGQPLRIDLTQLTPIEFDLVELPAMFSPDQVKSLSDVAKLGGSILGSTGTVADFRHLPTSSPLGVCPPIAGALPGKT